MYVRFLDIQGQYYCPTLGGLLRPSYLYGISVPTHCMPVFIYTETVLYRPTLDALSATICLCWWIEEVKVFTAIDQAKTWLSLSEWHTNKFISQSESLLYQRQYNTNLYGNQTVVCRHLGVPYLYTDVLPLLRATVLYWYRHYSLI